MFVDKGHSFERDDEEEKVEKHETRFLPLVFSLSRDGKYLFLDAYNHLPHKSPQQILKEDEEQINRRLHW